ncbi:hypothetical protein B9Z19DRAFT_1073250 [Tuber borchii]|uniref:Transmembrane protein n=1 Tax=Tuber borchii TaxID=42251 RepID=A0A2T7A637_TUBBO|nr:hypothetical protein B9Z19DRAFT_1073250 [Tuber borchii]
MSYHCGTDTLHNRSFSLSTFTGGKRRCKERLKASRKENDCRVVSARSNAGGKIFQKWSISDQRGMLRASPRCALILLIHSFSFSSFRFSIFFLFSLPLFSPSLLLRKLLIRPLIMQGLTRYTDSNGCQAATTNFAWKALSLSLSEEIVCVAR